MLITNSVRAAAVQQILPHLASAEDANTARPNVDQALVSSLTNLYSLRNTVVIALDTSNKSVLKVKIRLAANKTSHLETFRSLKRFMVF